VTAPLVVTVVGPTATGKSDLALELAIALGGEVVNADALQLYRGMDIGTAKLTPDERRGVRHHLLDVLDPAQEASVADYQAWARAAVDDCHARGRRAVAAGGSGLYVRALLDHMEFPGADPEVRARFEARVEAEGSRALHDELARLDPAAAAAIGPRNARRIVRALEVIALTGRPYSSSLPRHEYEVPAVQIGLDCDRAVLDARIEARTERMYAAGLVAEVERLVAHGWGRTAARAVGYAEAVALLRGEMTPDEAHAATSAGTRRLARKQMGWFGRDPRVHWLDAQDPDVVAQALDLVARADRGQLGPATDDPAPRRSLGAMSATAETTPQPATAQPGTVQPVPVPSTALHVTKGHGTQNDFVLVDDRDGVLELGAPLVRALADRRAGVGADGVIRLVATQHVAEGAALLADSPEARWFMDYRNADGSVAEMCGNGVRVFALYLDRLGLWPDGEELAVGTRSGVMRVRRAAVPAGIDDAAWFAFDIGRWHVPGGQDAVAAGFDAEVVIPGLDVARPALGIDVGNPHTVLALRDEAELEAADLTRGPQVHPVPPHGTNVELVVPLGESDVDGRTTARIRMRVHERGVGETRSCGTGAVAAAMAVRTWAGAAAPDDWLVDVPGGTVRVRSLPDGHAELAGPAVLVAEMDVDIAALLDR
jgi:tRNA dimethylallyltransferase/diaminopimelate epimerase